MSRLCILIMVIFLAACSPNYSDVSDDNEPVIDNEKDHQSTTDIQPETLVEVTTSEGKKELATMVVKSVTEDHLRQLIDESDRKNSIQPTDKPAILIGQLDVLGTDELSKGLKVALTVSNEQSYAVYLEFRSGMSADLAVLDANKLLWKWSDDMMFTQAINYQTIKPGKQAKFGFTIPKTVLKGLKSKTYTLRADFKGVATEMTELTINPIYGELNLKL